MAYDILVSPEATEHLQALTARQRATLVAAMREQLTHEPHVATRNRKPMRRNPLAPWELRVGELRLYYSMRETPCPTVRLVAIGVKKGSRISIGGQEVTL